MLKNKKKGFVCKTFLNWNLLVVNACLVSCVELKICLRVFLVILTNCEMKDTKLNKRKTVIHLRCIIYQEVILKDKHHTKLCIKNIFKLRILILWKIKLSLKNLKYFLKQRKSFIKNYLIPQTSIAF